MGLKNLLSATQILTIFVFWGQIQNYMMRANASILIVAMVKERASKGSSNHTTCPENRMVTLNKSNDLSAGDNDTMESVQFDWGPFTQGQVLAAFSYGYVTTQVIGGRLAEKFGIKKVYGGALFLVGILTFLLPEAAKLDAKAFMAVRIIQGILEGVSFPSLHAMTARWIPPASRNTFIAGVKRSYVLFRFVISPQGHKSDQS